MKHSTKTNTAVRLTKWLACLTALAALLGTNAVRAQTWQTVLDYQFAAGKGSSGRAIAADASGNVFSGGEANGASGVECGLLLKTDTTQLANTDPSAILWYFGDNNNPDPTQYMSDVQNVGVDAGGNVYSMGQLFPLPAGTGIPYWYIRKSSDSGLQWSTVDLYQYAPGQFADATGFAADNSGSIYVAGWARDAGTKRNPMGNLHWLVRKRTDDGQWAVVDDVQGNPGAYGAGFVAGAGVFVVGGQYIGGGWLVRRSVTGDLGTWSTVDGPVASGAARGVCGDSQGNIYVSGSQFIATGKAKGQTVGYYAWSTRRSADGGNTWSTADTYTYAQNQSAEGAYGSGTDSAGNAVVVGEATDAQGIGHWIVRRHSPSGGWQRIDDFQLVTGYGAIAQGVATDAAGDLLVTGEAYDGTSWHWIVRKWAP